MEKFRKVTLLSDDGKKTDESLIEWATGANFFLPEEFPPYRIAVLFSATGIPFGYETVDCHWVPFALTLPEYDYIRNKIIALTDLPCTVLDLPDKVASLIGWRAWNLCQFSKVPYDTALYLSLEISIAQQAYLNAVRAGAEPEALRHLKQVLNGRREAAQQVFDNAATLPTEKNQLTLNFYSALGNLGYLSNFYKCPFELDGQIWATSEHYFQAQKITDLEYRERIRTAATPTEAARLGRSRKVAIRADWECIKDQVMKDAVFAKFDQNPAVKKLLLATGNAILIEHTKNDKYWGDGGNGKGKNMLGKILMEVRAAVTL
jgi:N-glycosidase YbiA